MTGDAVRTSVLEIVTRVWISGLVKIARHLVHELAGFLKHVQLGLLGGTTLIDDVDHTENSANDDHHHERSPSSVR